MDDGNNEGSVPNETGNENITDESKHDAHSYEKPQSTSGGRSDIPREPRRLGDSFPGSFRAVPLSPQTRETIARLANSVLGPQARETMARLANSAVSQRTREAIANAVWPSGIAERQQEMVKRLGRSFPMPIISIPRFNLNLQRFFPPNWREASEPVDVEKAIELMNVGIPLIWIPRGVIIAEVIQAPDVAARDRVLTSHRIDIVDDCLAVLHEVNEARLEPLAGLAVVAANALRDGHGAAAQALASNVFDTWLRDAFKRGVVFAPIVGRFKYPNVRDQIEPISDATKLAEFQEQCAMAPALAALKDFQPTDPTPTQYGRHPTAHSTRPEQYTEANAIVALMLTTSLLRQAQTSGW